MLLPLNVDEACISTVPSAAAEVGTGAAAAAAAFAFGKGFRLCFLGGCSVDEESLPRLRV